MVPKALDALVAADVVLGYKTYLGLIEELLNGKEVLSSGMRKEVDRCGLAIDRALGGRRVVLVSSGDAGIYGMAGLVFDICRERNLHIAGPTYHRPSSETETADPQEGRGEPPPDLFVEVIPGVAAFNAAASILGAPLMHDFAVVSLSDHLTPWELIEKRLQAAASADFVMAIYNPRSKTRPNLLEKAQTVLLREKAPETPVAIIRKAMRDGQWRCLATLGEIPFEEVDMQSILIVGNSKTYVWNGWMVTPRGYLDKYTVAEQE
jgi:precorrin-3B C17-methyltransferase